MSNYSITIKFNGLPAEHSEQRFFKDKKGDFKQFVFAERTLDKLEQHYRDLSFEVWQSTKKKAIPLYKIDKTLSIILNEFWSIKQ